MLRGLAAAQVIVDEADDWAAALAEFNDGPPTVEIPPIRSWDIIDPEGRIAAFDL